VPTIIRDLPYFDQPTRVQVRGRSFSVKRDQIVVWIGITEKGIQDLDPRTPCFPAILDIGCHYNLLINEQHMPDRRKAMRVGSLCRPQRPCLCRNLLA
jgi:hypothetical protein